MLLFLLFLEASMGHPRNSDELVGEILSAERGGDDRPMRLVRRLVVLRRQILSNLPFQIFEAPEERTGSRRIRSLSSVQSHLLLLHPERRVMVGF